MAPRVKITKVPVEPKIISKEKFQTVIKKLKAEESVISESKGTMGSVVERAVAEHNLHPDALRVFRKYAKKNPVQQAEFYLQLSTYWEYGALGEPNQDLVETPAQRKGGRPKKHPEMKNAISPEAERLLGRGTHKIENGRVVPIQDAAE